MDYSNILLTHYSGKDWSIIGNDYDALIWNDSSSKPTKDELDAKITALNNAEPIRLLRLERDRLLKETDWRASSDRVLPESWRAYRQALRDLPANAKPKLDENGRLDMSSVAWPSPST